MYSSVGKVLFDDFKVLVQIPIAILFCFLNIFWKLLRKSIFSRI